MLDEDKEEECASRGEHVAASQTMVWNEVNKRIHRSAPTKSRPVFGNSARPAGTPCLGLVLARRPFVPPPSSKDSSLSGD